MDGWGVTGGLTPTGIAQRLPPSRSMRFLVQRASNRVDYPLIPHFSSRPVNLRETVASRDPKPMKDAKSQPAYTRSPGPSKPMPARARARDPNHERPRSPPSSLQGWCRMTSPSRSQERVTKRMGRPTPRLITSARPTSHSPEKTRSWPTVRMARAAIPREETVERRGGGERRTWTWKPTSPFPHAADGFALVLPSIAYRLGFGAGSACSKSPGVGGNTQYRQSLMRLLLGECSSECLGKCSE